LLWLGPPGLLLGGALVLLVVGRRRSRAGNARPGAEVAALTPAEEARLAGLMQASEPVAERQ
jgi:cytochrome c-type biogenesis protein CcmH/NrfF